MTDSIKLKKAIVSADLSCLYYKVKVRYRWTDSNNISTETVIVRVPTFFDVTKWTVEKYIVDDRIRELMARKEAVKFLKHLYSSREIYGATVVEKL